MRIGFVGFGKMARAIDALAQDLGHEVVVRVDGPGEFSRHLEAFRSVDVAFEFTQPEAAVGNIRLALEHGIPLVCGTTGWHAHLPEIEALAARHPASALFYAPNFSPGVNIALRISRLLAQYVGHFPGYRVEIDETHHTQKLDAPSGTAIALAQPFIGPGGRYQNWALAPTSEPTALPISAHRVDNVPGIHQIRLVGTHDELSIRHEAYDRVALAQGAIAAAEFLRGRNGIFTMDDLLALG